MDRSTGLEKGGREPRGAKEGPPTWSELPKSKTEFSGRITSSRNPFRSRNEKRHRQKSFPLCRGGERVAAAALLAQTVCSFSLWPSSSGLCRWKATARNGQSSRLQSFTVVVREPFPITYVYRTSCLRNAGELAFGICITDRYRDREILNFPRVSLDACAIETLAIVTRGRENDVFCE